MIAEEVTGFQFNDSLNNYDGNSSQAKTRLFMLRSVWQRSVPQHGEEGMTASCGRKKENRLSPGSTPFTTEKLLIYTPE